MGRMLFDQYTLLHFAVGIVAYFWGFTLNTFIIIHTLFEIIENTDFGINFINKYLTIWPGGKPQADNILNILGDTIGGLFGWICAYKLDKYGIKRKWYL